MHDVSVVFHHVTNHVRNHHEFTHVEPLFAPLGAPQVPHQHSSHLPGVVPTSPRCPRGPRPQGPLRSLLRTARGRHGAADRKSWTTRHDIDGNLYQSEQKDDETDETIVVQQVHVLFGQFGSSSDLCPRLTVAVFVWQEFYHVPSLSSSGTNSAKTLSIWSAFAIWAAYSSRLDWVESYGEIFISWPPLAMFLHQYRLYSLSGLYYIWPQSPEENWTSESSFWTISIWWNVPGVESSIPPNIPSELILNPSGPSQTYSKHDERRRPRTRHCAPNGPPRPTLGMRCLRALKSCKEPKPSHTSQRFLTISIA